VAQVVSCKQDFESLKTNVVTISFGTPYWARIWLEETRSPFPLLLDSERTAYQAYGLERSLLRSWGWQTMSYYARALWNGEEWRGIRGDSSQLGGDFIVDSKGFVRLAHPSRNPTDRPPVGELLSLLQQQY
jgi:alkyl hydroperoxide reductase subunit AhpC